MISEQQVINLIIDMEATYGNDADEWAQGNIQALYHVLDRGLTKAEKAMVKQVKKEKGYG